MIKPCLYFFLKATKFSNNCPRQNSLKRKEKSTKNENFLYCEIIDLIAMDSNYYLLFIQEKEILKAIVKS